MNARDLELVFYVFGDDYISTFLNYCVPSLLAGANGPIVRRSRVSIWTRSHKEQNRISQALDAHELDYVVYRLQPFENKSSYTHIDFWMQRFAESSSKKILFLVPDHYYANDALKRCVGALENNECVMFKGLYTLKEAVPAAALASPETMDSNRIFELYVDYGHPNNLSWLIQSGVVNECHDNILSLQNDSFTYQPIDNHVHGFNLEKVQNRRLDGEFCDSYPGDEQRCAYVPNVALSLDDILNQFNMVSPISAPLQRKFYVERHVLHRRRSSRRYPERDQRVVFDLKNRTTRLENNYVPQDWMGKILHHPHMVEYYVRLCLNAGRAFPKESVDRRNVRWPVADLSFNPNNNSDSIEERRKAAKKLSHVDIAKAYLSVLEPLSPDYMGGTRLYLQKLVAGGVADETPVAQSA